MIGASSKSDRMRIEWKQGGKVLATADCTNNYDDVWKSLSGSCDLKTEVKAKVKAKGPIDVDLIYSDDKDDKDYLVATLKLNVRQWKGIGKGVDWGYVPDDVLALAFVRYEEGSAYFKETLFEFWSTADLNAEQGPTMRCSVNGKQLPDSDVKIGNKTGSDQTQIESVSTTEKTRKAYRFNHFGVVSGFKFGRKQEFADKRDASKARFLIDNPGKWECNLRIKGKTVRQFSFVVNDKGRVEPSEMQSGKNPIKMPDNITVIDMRIPKDNGYEKRIRPDALKKSRGWGLPWPDHPKAKEAQGAFPPAMGTPD